MGQRIATLPFGYFETTGENETKLVSTKSDPAFHRISILRSKIESNLGGISIGIEREDGSGIDDQMIVIQGRMRADKKGAAVYIALAPEIGATVQEVCYIDNNVAIFHVPVQAPNISAGGIIVPDIIRSQNGKILLAMQNDENMVLYHNGKPIKAMHGLPIGQIW